MPTLELPPTHSAFLELKEERDAMQEGYRFLDEKRLILASEILAELGRYEQAMEAFRTDYTEAVARLREAVGRHGLDGIQVYPAAAPVTGGFELRVRSLLGVKVQEVECHPDPIAAPAAVDPSPEGDACREAFRTLIPQAADLAAMAGNLERLRREYLRTARRARAVEDVLLPEVEEALHAIDAVLEEQEREEAIRVRWAEVLGAQGD